ncbi:hypothetical protein [Streptomyces gilvifuscus]|uniref:Uncharacterized protein n=1 Tax=Streptomyces gilvifuscus TaxID=1550617 RepID=A0ABT5FLV6_9ACTN|nr:hypothetical protein [Streptomyces gilvifuscus]MDC2953497.1 hypothetical protein [Streptomyces gilvifuscus]
MESWRCHDCGTYEDFRPLTASEREYVRGRIPNHTRLSSYLVCTREGCRRYQRRGDWTDGAKFPDPDKS